MYNNNSMDIEKQNNETHKIITEYFEAFLTFPESYVQGKTSVLRLLSPQKAGES